VARAAVDPALPAVFEPLPRALTTGCLSVRPAHRAVTRGWQLLPRTKKSTMSQQMSICVPALPCTCPCTKEANQWRVGSRWSTYLKDNVCRYSKLAPAHVTCPQQAYMCPALRRIGKHSQTSALRVLCPLLGLGQQWERTMRGSV
jgi:hypothetical protein